jgi:predicted RNA-binding protein YlxR (DUF448 family)
MGRPKSNASPLRTCRMCRKRFAKNDLERWVLRGNDLILDIKQNEPGRGWYSCRRSVCSRKMHEVGAQVALSRRHRRPKQENQS